MFYRWNDWNIGHIAEHGISPVEAKFIVDHARRPFPQMIGDEKRLVMGQTGNGVYAQVIYVLDEDGTVYVIPLQALDRSRKASIPQEQTMSASTKKYWEMNRAELAAATREFDQEFIADKARPMTPAERAAERRARLRGPGRPKIGKGAQKIHITLERGLLQDADRMARQKGLGRSELIARVLASVIGRPRSRKAS